MSNEKMTYQDLLQIVELVKASSQFSEFHLKVGDVEVDLKRHSAGTPSRAADPQAQISTAVNDTARAIPLPVSASQPVETARTIRHRPGHVGGGEIVTELPPDVGAIETPHRSPPLDYPESAVLIKSPMVGTFYRAPEPGARPFVDIGQPVETDTTVCIIEVMKLMNSIPAGTQGVVTHLLVEDGDPVEYGQVLMVIEPR